MKIRRRMNETKNLKQHSAAILTGDRVVVVGFLYLIFTRSTRPLSSIIQYQPQGHPTCLGHVLRIAARCLSGLIRRYPFSHVPVILVRENYNNRMKRELIGSSREMRIRKSNGLLMRRQLDIRSRVRRAERTLPTMETSALHSTLLILNEKLHTPLQLQMPCIYNVMFLHASNR